MDFKITDEYVARYQEILSSIEGWALTCFTKDELMEGIIRSRYMLKYRFGFKGPSFSSEVDGREFVNKIQRQIHDWEKDIILDVLKLSPISNEMIIREFHSNLTDASLIDETLGLYRAKLKPVLSEVPVNEYDSWSDPLLDIHNNPQNFYNKHITKRINEGILNAAEGDLLLTMIFHIIEDINMTIDDLNQRFLNIKIRGLSNGPESLLELGSLPPELDTERARKYFRKAIEYEWIKPTSTGYNFNKSKTQLAYFTEKVFCPDKTDVFPEIALGKLFGVTRLGSARTQIYNAKNPQKWRAEIDNFFTD